MLFASSYIKGQAFHNFVALSEWFMQSPMHLSCMFVSTLFMLEIGCDLTNTFCLLLLVENYLCEFIVV